MKRPACEEALFESNDGIDFVSDTAIVFYNPVLKVDIGEFPAGTQFDGIMIDTEHSQIALQNFDEDTGALEEEYVFALSYQIGEKIVDNDQVSA